MCLSDTQREILTLWYVVNASLVSYYKLLEAFKTPARALSAGAFAWQSLSVNNNHIKRLKDDASTNAFLYGINEQLDKKIFGLICYQDDDYPSFLKELYDPPPVLFYKGNKDRLTAHQLAVVGTRNPSEYAQKITFDMAQYWAEQGFVITSGLALGVDSCAHRGALSQTLPDLQGMTVGVMGTGIDICYPKQNQGLLFDIIAKGGCVTSELLPGTPASKYSFPRRNRIVTGLSLATILTEAALQSGSMISAKLTAEQGKQVFALPGRIDGVNAEGCHHLIREGATLIYHPKQVLDDLNQVYVKPLIQKFNNTSLQKTITVASQITPIQRTPDIPGHLINLYNTLQYEAQDLDKLVIATELDVGLLLGWLVELELLGLATQQGGRYARA